jgi:hypothetical protein
MSNGKSVIFLLLFLGLFAPLFVQAAAINLNLEYPLFFDIDLATEEGQNLESLIAWFYAFVVGIAGLAAFVMIVWGGVQWMTSTGDPTKTSDAKDRIKQALLGLLLILASFVVLRTINPELTTLRITGLPSVECPTNRDNDGKCVPLPPPTQDFSFTVNGNKSSVLVAPDEQVTLRWVAPLGAQTCQVSSAPTDIWEGEKPTSGTDSFASLPGGTNTFFLACLGGLVDFTRNVVVIVSSDEITDETEPSVVLLVNGFPGPLTLPSEELPDLRLDFTWEATNAHQCVGENEFSFPGDSLSGSKRLIFGGRKGDHLYTITCTNINNGTSASDTVLITVDI